MQSNRGRVCIDEYARTHVHPSYKHRGVVHELLRVPSFYRPFFFFHAPSSSFRTPQWIVQFTVPIWPWITLLPSYTYTWKQLLLKLSRAFRCFFSPMTWLWTILPYSTLHSPVFIYFSFFFSLPSSLPFFFPRKTNSIFDYICSGYVVTRYNHLTARSKPFLRGI